jgi:hypothetical protein
MLENTDFLLCITHRDQRYGKLRGTIINDQNLHEIDYKPPDLLFTSLNNLANLETTLVIS